jgi:hypothetical protein
LDEAGEVEKAAPHLTAANQLKHELQVSGDKKRRIFEGFLFLFCFCKGGQTRHDFASRTIFFVGSLI